MKNRTWLPLTLDYLGLFALLCAAVALGSALYLAGSRAEVSALAVFKTSLMCAIAALLSARISEIFAILSADPAPRKTLAPSNNIETLPERDSLPRAA